MSEEASWPYEKIENLNVASDPSWICPEGTCACHGPTESGDGYEFSVMLCHHNGERMSFARCRVVIDGILANPEDPHADGQGWITVAVAHEPKTVLIEWATPETPQSSSFPFRRRYYVDLADHDRDEAARRRLHNLGFLYFRTLHDNVADFQGEYGYPVVNGQLDDIENDLRAFHDDAMLPITSARSTSESPIVKTSFGLVPQGGSVPVAQAPAIGPVKPQPPPASPPTKGKPKTGNVEGAGTVKLSISPEIYLPNVIEVIGSGDAKYEFRSIRSTFTDTNGDIYVGVFWIFVDALKDKRTGLRLPCMAAEAQKAADLIRLNHSDLPGWSGSPPNKPEPLGCFLPTPKLIDVRWSTAAARNPATEPLIRPAPQDNGGKDPKTGAPILPELLKVTTRRLNKSIDSQILTPDQWVADPGKVWALWDPNDGRKLFGAINYGWHFLSGPKDLAHLNAVTPGQFVAQSPGATHNQYHIDYSQTLTLVAGWCQVLFPGQTKFEPMWTETIYKSGSRQLASLINERGVPLMDTRQAFDEAKLAEYQRVLRETQERRYRQYGRRAKNGEAVPLD